MQLPMRFMRIDPKHPAIVRKADQEFCIKVKIFALYNIGGVHIRYMEEESKFLERKE